MIHLALWVASALFLAWFGLLALLVFLGAIGSMSKSKPASKVCLNKSNFPDHDPRNCQICLGGGHA